MTNRLPLGNVLGDLHFPENLRWHEARLFFSDMYGDRIYCFDPLTAALDVVADLYHPAGLGWLPDGRLLAVATEDRKVFSVSPDGNEVYADLSAAVPAWANDMLIDGEGWAIVGNFGFDLFTETQRDTHLTIVAPDGSIHRGPGELSFPNGMVVRSDGTLIVAETFAGQLAIFDRDLGGTLRRAGAISLGESVTPDGICIDEADGIWIASPQSSELIYAGPQNRVTRFSLETPPYACMLGGADRRTLFIAVSPDHMPEQRRRAREGRIQAVTVEVPGVGSDGLGIGRTVQQRSSRGASPVTHRGQQP
jgi:sugar lactone lactonase YvrE